MSRWLVDADTLGELRAAQRLEPTAAQHAEYAALLAAYGNGGAPRGFSVAGDTAQINVSGLLVQRPSLVALIMGLGFTCYSDITNALAAAAADPAIKRVSMAVNSPGGEVGGLFDCLAALESFGKPIDVTAGQACSAAFALAAAAGPITATNAAAMFGSVGIAASFTIDDGVVDVTSSAAPNKRPDVQTDEGRAVVRAELDALHQLFADSIARGRGTTVATVNRDFGKGGTLLAKQARDAGMIDGIAAQPRARRASTSTGSSAAAPGSQLERAQAMLAELEQQPSAGPQQKAAARLAASLGDASTRGSNEGQAAFAARVLAPHAPPAPQPMTLGQKVLAILRERNSTATKPTPQAASSGLQNLFSGGLIRPEAPIKGK